MKFVFRISAHTTAAMWIPAVAGAQETAMEGVESWWPAAALLLAGAAIGGAIARSASRRAFTARLREIVEGFPAGFILFGPNGGLIMHNRRYHEMIGLGADKLSPGVTYEQVLRNAVAGGAAPDAEGREEEWIAERLNAPTDDEDGDAFKNGAGRWVKPYQHIAGDGSLVGIRVDVTEIREQTEALERSRKAIVDASDALRKKTVQLEMIVGISAIGGWSYDVRSGAVEWDEQVRRIHGVPDDFEPNLKSSLDFHSPWSRRLVESAIARSLGTGRGFDLCVELTSAAGRLVRARAIGECVMEGGDVVRINGVIQDISQQKAQEEKLRKTNAELRAAAAERDAAEKLFFDIAAISSDWFWEQDAEGRFTFISKSYENATGGDTTQFIGRTRAELQAQSPMTNDGVDWSWLEARYAAREKFSDFVYPIHRSDQSREAITYARISGAPFHHADGRFAGYRGVGSDVTALYSAMKSAEAANESKSAFLANMSHEIRTPLNGVLGLAEALRGHVDAEPAKDLVDGMCASGEQLLNVINDILDFSKIEAGRLDLEDAPYKLRDLQDRTKTLHSEMAKEKGLAFVVRTDAESGVWIRGDCHRMLQILNNLVGNAIKFTDKGKVAVKIGFTDESGLSLEVADTGVGMNEEERARAFKDFMQGDSTTTRRFGGTGLGMSIARSIAKAMDGEVEIESAPGVGTTVRVRVPAKRAERPEPAVAITTKGPPSGLSILAVDDNATNRMLLELMLKRTAARMVSVDSGAGAVEAVKSDQFDLILLDISMPGMDGIETLSRIRAIEAAAGEPATPAIAVTANAMRHQVEEYLANGFDGHVAKPIQMETLSERIASVVGRRRRPGEASKSALPRTSGALRLDRGAE